MGLDGAKIIDGDLANDIYNDFMSLYDEGYEIEEIIPYCNKMEREYLLRKGDMTDEF